MPKIVVPLLISTKSKGRAQTTPRFGGGEPLPSSSLARWMVTYCLPVGLFLFGPPSLPPMPFLVRRPHTTSWNRSQISRKRWR